MAISRTAGPTKAALSKLLGRSKFVSGYGLKLVAQLPLTPRPARRKAR